MRNSKTLAPAVVARTPFPIFSIGNSICMRFKRAKLIRNEAQVVISHSNCMHVHCSVRLDHETETKRVSNPEKIYRFETQSKAIRKEFNSIGKKERRNHSVTVFIKLFSIILIRINLNPWNIRAIESTFSHSYKLWASIHGHYILSLSLA